MAVHLEISQRGTNEVCAIFVLSFRLGPVGRSAL